MTDLRKRLDEAASACAQDCGLTLGTDQANAVITGYQQGALESPLLIEAIEALEKAREEFAFHGLYDDADNCGLAIGRIKQAKEAPIR